MTKKAVTEIVFPIEGNTLEIWVIDEHGDPIEDFKTELWYNYGKRYEEDMLGGKYIWRIGSTTTTLWVFIEGEYTVNGKTYLINVSYEFKGFSSNFLLKFQIRDWEVARGVYSLKEPG